MSNTYDMGDLVRVSVIFKNIAGTVTDPTTVTLKYRNPAGTVTAWTVTAGQIVKDSTGNYHADISPTTAGVWQYKWTGTGAVQAVEELSFAVKNSLIE